MPLIDLKCISVWTSHFPRVEQPYLSINSVLARADLEGKVLEYKPGDRKMSDGVATDEAFDPEQFTYPLSGLQFPL